MCSGDVLSVPVMSDADDFGVDPLDGYGYGYGAEKPQQYLYTPPVQFGGGFTPGQLISTGVISFGIAKVLGASVPGAIVMGFGNLLWEAGSGNIPGGWRRYILGLFRKPE